MHLLHNEDQADVVLIRVLPAVITTILTFRVIRAILGVKKSLTS